MPVKLSGRGTPCYSAHRATIFLHPIYICGDDRLGADDLLNAVGRLTDTTIAMARLFFSGHVTRFPASPSSSRMAAARCPTRSAGCDATIRSTPMAVPIRSMGFAVSISTRCCSSRRRYTFLCDVAARTRWCWARTIPSLSAIRSRHGWSRRHRSPRPSGTLSSAKLPRAFFSSIAVVSAAVKVQVR
jgi:hypothetical protein